MGSFADGMKMGQGAYQMALNNRRQEEKDAREKVMQGREDTAYEQAQADLKGVNDAKQAYGLMMNQGVQNKANIQANDMDFDMAVEATGRGLPVPAANPQMPEWNPATDLDKNRGLQKLSFARNDFNGVASLQKEEGKLVENEAFKTHLKNYTGAPEQITPTARYLNLRSGAVTMHAPDKNGLVRLSVVKPDGDAEYMKLSRQDQAQLYAAGNMLTEYPERALQIMAGINKDLAAAIAAENGLTGKLADNANDVATKGNAMRNDNARTGIAASGLALRREEGSRTSPQNLKEFVDAKGNTVLLDVTGLPKDKEGRLGIPAGLRPKTARPEYTMKDVTDLAEMYVGQPDPDAPKVAMSATRAMQVARQELGAGGTTSSASDAMLAGLPMEDPRKTAPPTVPKSGMAPPRQITTIVPPRSGADMRPRPVESDQEIFIRSMGY